MNNRRLIQEWLLGVRIMSIAHERLSERYSRRHLHLGWPTIIFTAAASTTILVNLSNNVPNLVRYIACCLGFIAVTFASLQTFFGFSSLSQKHKTARDRFSNLRREMETILTKQSSEKELEVLIEKIREKWSIIQADSPNVPQAIHDSARAKLIEELKKRVAQKCNKPKIQST